MQDYDNTLKYLSDKFPQHYVDLIFEGFNGDIALLDRELTSTNRKIDYLVKIKDITKHTEFILHIEFQSSYDVNMPYRMLSYYTRIFDKFKLPIYPVVIYLYPDRPRFGILDSYVSSINNKDILTFKFEVLKAWEIEANRIIDNNLYGLFPILPLVKHRKIDDKDYLIECFDLVQNIDIEDNKLKADIYFSTGTLAGLRYSKELIKTLMKVEILEESEIYQDVLNKGMEKGRNEGIKEGMERGMERGIKEGMKKGMEKGIEKSIIYVLSTRFNNISPNLIDLIYRTKDESQLYRFLELAVKTNSLSEFEKNM